MKIDLKTIIIIVLLLLLGGVFLYSESLKDDIGEAKTELKREKIKSDSLTKEYDGLWTKYAADTNTVKELRKIIDSLKIKADNPRIVTVTEFIPRDETDSQPADNSTQTDSTYSIVDYYPKGSESPFIKYESEINYIEGTDRGKFTFPNPISISMVVEEKEGGLFDTQLKAPDWIELTKFDFNSLPIEPYKPDNFGILVGAGYGTDFSTGMNYLEVGTGIRYKKFYIELEGNTNNQADLGIKFEF